LSSRVKSASNRPSSTAAIIAYRLGLSASAHNLLVPAPGPDDGRSANENVSLIRQLSEPAVALPLLRSTASCYTSIRSCRLSVPSVPSPCRVHRHCGRDGQLAIVVYSNRVHLSISIRTQRIIAQLADLFISVPRLRFMLNA